MDWGSVLRRWIGTHFDRANTTLRVGMASDCRAGTARLVKHLNSARRSKVAKCRREAVERIITAAMGAPLDVTELR